MILQSPKPILRTAVIGAGVMGQHHLRICSLLKGINLVGVVDIHEDRAREAGFKFGCQAYSCLEDLVGKVDAVIIAVPTQAHVSIGLFFLQHNIHCLIEKPLAYTEDECLSLITLAEQKSLVLAVGHIEHYNAGVQELRKLIDKNHSVLTIEASRVNYGSRRISDVDVVLDLMIHDLEVVEFLMNHSVLTVNARSVKQAVSQDLHHVVADIAFSNGAIANLTASRVTPASIRKLQVTTDKAYFTLDYQTQELFKFELLSEKRENSGFEQASFKDKVVFERIPVRMQDSLITEISVFREAVFFGEKQYVNGWQALSSLKLAWTIQEKAKASLSVFDPLKVSSEQAILAE